MRYSVPGFTQGLEGKQFKFEADIHHFVFSAHAECAQKNSACFEAAL